MEFEFDPRKSAANKKKHGIDFIEAKELWSDPDLLEIPAKTTDEPGYLVVGIISDKLNIGRRTVVSMSANYLGPTPQPLTFLYN
jgi:uncharacterized DUF497 family protein